MDKDSEPKHEGFWIDTEHGDFHVLGDPNMSEEQKEALRAVARAAWRMIGGKDEEQGSGENDPIK
jgi:hypothetical protein